MDPFTLIPMVADQLGIPPSSLVFYLFVLSGLANVTARLIPDDATGWKATVRKVASIVGVYVSSRVTSGVTVNDVAKAALETPPIPQRVAADTDQPVAAVQPNKE
jgi:hypothetical protein